MITKTEIVVAALMISLFMAAVDRVWTHGVTPYIEAKVSK